MRPSLSTKKIQEITAVFELFDEADPEGVAEREAAKKAEADKAAKEAAKREKREQWIITAHFEPACKFLASWKANGSPNDFEGRHIITFDGKTSASRKTRK